MKIKDIINEDVDMSWWKEKDELFNPEALEYIEKQEKRDKIVHSSKDGTPVFTKPVRKSQERFSNQPKEGEPKSAGFAGLTDVRVRAGHISKDDGDDLVTQ